MDKNNAVLEIPDEVQAAYAPDGINEVQILSGGIINHTLRIIDAQGATFILQRLSPIFDERLQDDYDTVTRHLQHDGWEVPLLHPTIQGSQSLRDQENNLWRAMTFIDAEPLEGDLNSEALIALSGLLGRLHRSLATLNYHPSFGIPHFHETDHYVGRLDEVLPDLTSVNKRTAAFISEVSAELTLPGTQQQLIHGDPQAHNALYRNRLPFTFIDYDTLMMGNPLIDVGDMLRSVTGKLLKVQPSFSAEMLQPVIDEYHLQAEVSYTRSHFFELALRAGRLISLELAARFLIDTVEDYYFEWDSTQYTSRSAQNSMRAAAQLKIYEALNT